MCASPGRHEGRSVAFEHGARARRRTPTAARPPSPRHRRASLRRSRRHRQRRAVDTAGTLMPSPLERCPMPTADHPQPLRAAAPPHRRDPSRSGSVRPALRARGISNGNIPSRHEEDGGSAETCPPRRPTSASPRRRRPLLRLPNRFRGDVRGRLGLGVRRCRALERRLSAATICAPLLAGTAPRTSSSPSRRARRPARARAGRSRLARGDPAPVAANQRSSSRRGRVPGDLEQLFLALDVLHARERPRLREVAHRAERRPDDRQLLQRRATRTCSRAAPGAIPHCRDTQCAHDLQPHCAHPSCRSYSATSSSHRHVAAWIWDASSVISRSRSSSGTVVAPIQRMFAYYAASRTGAATGGRRCRVTEQPRPPATGRACGTDF